MKYLYFAEASSPPLIKIGITTQPENRFNDLAAGALQDLTVRAVMLGDEVMERSLHSAWKHCRSHREWYYKTDDLDDFISGIPSIVEPFVVTYTTRTKFDLEPLAVDAMASGIAGDAVKFLIESTISW